MRHSANSYHSHTEHYTNSNPTDPLAQEGIFMNFEPSEDFQYVGFTQCKAPVCRSHQLYSVFPGAALTRVGNVW